MAGNYITGNCQEVSTCTQEVTFASFNAGEENGYEDDVISGQQENGTSIFSIVYEYGGTAIYLDTADGTFDGTQDNITVSYNDGENERVMSYDLDGYYRSYEYSSFFETYALAGNPVSICITSGGNLPS